MYSIRLKKGKDKAARQLHPWVFSGAIEHIGGKPDNGDIVAVTDHKNEFLAYGFFNDRSRVAVRLLEWNPEIEVNENWWRNRIQKSVQARKNLLLSTDTNAYRLIFSETDYLPGLIVDRYADFLSVQILSAGMEKIKAIVLDELQNLLNPAGMFDRSDTVSREHEGLEASSGILSGAEAWVFITVKTHDI